ncbi:MAG: glycogen/starch synthase [Desulfobacterales bacterium]|jgi:starch synthase|nr:glycogen/starch synthase [Desulfobacterales bacterium]
MDPIGRHELSLLMVAAENGALPGAKVGGLGDVIGSLPPALARRGCRIFVATPAYGCLHRGPGAAPLASLRFQFYGASQEAVMYALQPEAAAANVTHVAVDHPIFDSPRDNGRPRIYQQDPPDAPFATDATRFALFAAAMAEAVNRGLFGRLDCLHLHDWHAAPVLLLRRYGPGGGPLQAPRCVFTIHNLALQGVRPFEGHASSLAAWYPHLPVARNEIADPRWPNCVNPMAAGIRWADAVHTVSPSYAREVLQPSDPPRFFGGEGLEQELRAARAQGRLFGILNGTDYPEALPEQGMDFSEIVRSLKEKTIEWAGGAATLATAHFLAHSRLTDWGRSAQRPAVVLTSVTRAVEQKLFLMKAPLAGGEPALHRVLESLRSQGGVFILLGAGEPGDERFLVETSARFANFVFLNGYSEEAARILYAHGDLFIMPSSFEPCGISQMIAMRHGQPCVVHGVGGLKDTVIDAVNGFVFGGGSVMEQAENFVAACNRAVRCRTGQPAAWEEIRRQAAAARFTWDDTAAACIKQLYRRSD